MNTNMTQGLDVFKGFCFLVLSTKVGLALERLKLDMQVCVILNNDNNNIHRWSFTLKHLY